MKITRNESKPVQQCPVCGQAASKPLAHKSADLPPLGFLLRQQLKRLRPRKPEGRDWRVDPWPGDSISILDRAYFERPKPGRGFKVPLFRHVVQVSNNRVFYQTSDGGPVRSCSISTWRRLDADLAGKAITPPAKKQS
jgi:hypothetical protein